MNYDTLYVLLAVAFAGIWCLIGRIMVSERT